MLGAPDFKEKKVIVALISHGERLSFKNDNIIIKDINGDIRHQSTCYKLFALFVVGHFTITSGLLQRAKRFGFSIYLLTHGLKPYGSWCSKAEGNVLLRQKQYNYNKTDIAQYLVSQKIESQVNMLEKRRDKCSEIKTAIVNLHEYKDRLNSSTLENQEILGLEGISSKVYFKHMFNNIEWKGRKPRVKHDICNLLLDIGYTQLFNIIDALINLYGFDEYYGVYHQSFYQRKSLVCDLVEPFRPIVDNQVRKAFNLGQVHEEDFDFINNQYRIFGKKSQPYIAMLMQELIKNKLLMFYFVQGYYRAFMQEKAITEYPDCKAIKAKLAEKA